MISLETPLLSIRGIGPKFITHLERLRILSVRDLLWHFPNRYEDFSKVVKVADLQINQVATVSCVIKNISLRRSFRRRLFLVEATVEDDTGEIAAIWFNQPYLTSLLTPGKVVNLAGKVVLGNDQMYLSNPIYEFIGRNPVTKHTARLTPIYPETKGLTSKALRYLIKPILDSLPKLPEWIPTTTLKKNGLPEINSAMKRIHFPNTLDEVDLARKRFAFEDLFLLQMMNIRTRLELGKRCAPVINPSNTHYISEIKNTLPFNLTPSQESSLLEILNDLGRGRPMNRLLQGDVGSGKTVVSAIAGLACAKENYQVAFMTPTEILSRQHYSTLTKLFPNFEGGIGLLTSSDHKVYYGPNLETETKKNTLIEDIKKSKLKIIIGTQALIQESVIFESLALVVIDEQHRFGVEQRATLVRNVRDVGSVRDVRSEEAIRPAGGKRSNNPPVPRLSMRISRTQIGASGDQTTKTTIPHLLSMSATPIPRTLSLTIFGDLDLSIINELPSGRKPILTKIVSKDNRNKAYNFIREQIKRGRQAFVICPRIAASEEISDDPRRRAWAEIKNVTDEYEKLSQKIFPEFKVGMLHGKMKPREKGNIMKEFHEGKSNILVSTSVVEVGVDVPNASIMMIEGSDRFGLAQLYQFRGRVGRDSHQSFCFLFTDSESKNTEDRLKALLEAKNGFELAEKDLVLRGPGEFLGQKQTGIPDLAMKAIRNMELMKTAREDAENLLRFDPEIKKYPELKNRLDRFTKKIHAE